MPKDHLYKLVVSLKKGEKREFLALAKRHHRKPEYLKLFKVYLGLENYSGKAILSKLRISQKRLGQLKYELKKAIFEFLPHLNPSPRKRLTSAIFLIDELIARNHLELAVKEIRQSKREAQKIESPDLYESILARETSLPFEFQSRENQKSKEWLKAFRDEMHQYSRFLELVRSTIEEKSKRHKISRLKAISLDPLFQSSPRFTRAKEKYWLAKIIFAQLSGNWEQAIQYISKYLEIIEMTPEPFENSFELKIKQMRFLPLLFAQLRKEKAWLNSIAVIKQLSPRNDLQKASVFAAFTIPEISFSLATGKFTQIKNQYDHLHRKFHSLSPLISNNEKIQLIFMFAYFSLFTNNLPELLKWCRTFLNHNFYGPTSDEYLPYFRMLASWGYAIQGDFESMEHHLKSLSFHLNSRGIEYRYFKSVPRIARLLLNQQAISLPLDQLSYIQDLAMLKKDGFECRPFNYLDFVPWLFSITTGQSVEDILAKQYETEKRDFLGRRASVS